VSGGVMKDYKLKLRNFMKDYKLKPRNLRVSHTLSWSEAKAREKKSEKKEYPPKILGP
jgi:hypothetical protein